MGSHKIARADPVGEAEQPGNHLPVDWSDAVALGETGCDESKLGPSQVEVDQIVRRHWLARRCRGQVGVGGGPAHVADASSGPDPWRVKKA